MIYKILQDNKNLLLLNILLLSINFSHALCIVVKLCVRPHLSLFPKKLFIKRCNESTKVREWHSFHYTNPFIKVKSMTDWHKEFCSRGLAAARCHDAIACQLECRHGICVFPFALSCFACGTMLRRTTRFAETTQRE